MDPDPFIFGPPGSGFLKTSTITKSKKNLDFYYFFLLLFFFLFLKTDVNLPSKSKKQNVFFVVSDEKSRIRSRIRIRIRRSMVRFRGYRSVPKCSRIHNTAGDDLINAILN